MYSNASWYDQFSYFMTAWYRNFNFILTTIYRNSRNNLIYPIFQIYMHKLICFKWNLHLFVEIRTELLESWAELLNWLVAMHRIVENTALICFAPILSAARVRMNIVLLLFKCARNAAIASEYLTPTNLTLCSIGLNPHNLTLFIMGHNHTAAKYFFPAVENAGSPLYCRDFVPLCRGDPHIFNFNQEIFCYDFI